MTLPHAERIIDNLLETFRGISRNNGYQTDVAKVEPRGETLANPQPEDMPYIGIYEDGEERSTVTPGWIHWFYPITVVAHVRSSDRTDARELLALLCDDIERAMFRDPNRGTDPDIAGAVNAIKTGAVQSRRRMSAPDRTWAGMELHFEVEYEVERRGA